MRSIGEKHDYLTTVATVVELMELLPPEKQIIMSNTVHGFEVKEKKMCFAFRDGNVIVLTADSLMTLVA